MASIKLRGDTSGELVIEAPAVAGTNTLTLPAATANILTDTSSLPAANLTGSLPALDGSSLTGIPTIGVGQTWQNVGGSRSAGVTYTNTTGRSIEAMIQLGNGSAGNSNSYFNLVINGLTLVAHRLYAGTDVGLATFIVPNNVTYRIDIINAAGATIGAWFELR